MKILILLSLCVLCSIHPSYAIEDILTKGVKLYNIVKTLSYLTMEATTPELMFEYMNDEISVIGESIKHLKDEINDLEKGRDLDEVFNFITPFVKNMSSETGAHQWALDLRTQIKVVDSKFSEFMRICRESNNVKSWKTFAAERTDLWKKIRDIREMISLHSSLPSIVREVTISHLTHCNETLKIQHFLSHLFQALVKTEVKYLAMYTHATMIEHPASTVASRDWINPQLEEFKDRVLNYMSKFSSFMASAPSDMTACDPPNSTWVRDETYFEMERIEQVVIRHYRSLFRSKDCDVALGNEWLTFDTDRDSCDGPLSNCQYSGWLKVCRLKQSNGKRYEWIKAADGNYGTNVSNCINGTVSEYVWLSNLLESHCLCKCTENKRNFISLDPVMTNTVRNMVVTGLRFVRKNGILFVQVKQGKLLADGWIDEDTEKWIPLPDHPKKVAVTSTKKKFYLQDIKLDDNHLAVGVQFYDNFGFSLGVHARKFNFSTGKLEQHEYTSNPNGQNYQQLILPKKNSIYTNRTHTPSDPNKYWIELHMSDWSDAGQSMLPLFDGVAVEASAPVGGIGMVHKGVEGYAGFISPRLFPLLYKNHLLNSTGKLPDGRTIFD